MRKPPSWLFVFLTFLSCLSLSLAASPTSFCKCTCFGNSTIVALDAPSTHKKPANSGLNLRSPNQDNSFLDTRASKKTCNECNRQFCLSYPFCKGEKEEKVFATCFQRDSTKDQLVVFVFIGATVGLLGWAGIRGVLDRRAQGWTLVPSSRRG